MFLLGLFSMSIGIALSCRADLGTSPISSVPWVLSMIMPLTFGEITILIKCRLTLDFSHELSGTQHMLL